MSERRWDFRVLVRKDWLPDFEIAEVEYDEDGKPLSWCRTNVFGTCVFDNHPRSLQGRLDMMREALDRPFLRVDKHDCFEENDE